jgi:hypothetical protein
MTAVLMYLYRTQVICMCVCVCVCVCVYYILYRRQHLSRPYQYEQLNKRELTYADV